MTQLCICLNLIQTPNLLTEPRAIRHSYWRAMLVLERQDFTLTKYKKIETFEEMKYW
jgi:hypothetical protein